MLVDGVGGSEALDTAGERLSVSGCDITDLQRQKATIVFEHRSGSKGTPVDVVGRIIYGKKMFSREDAENDRQRYWWDRVRMPLIYVIGRLRDEEGHPGAVSLAAELRAAKAHGEPPLLGWSVEGKTITQDGNRLSVSVLRDVAITYKAANHTSSGIEILQDQEGPGAMTKAEADVYLADLAKATEAGFGDAAPGGRVQGAALAKDEDRPAEPAAASEPPAPTRKGPKAARAPKPPVQLTVRGQAAAPNPGVTEPRFDETQGILHLPEGSLRAYLPEHDGTDEQFRQILADPKVEQAHSQAMEGWIRAHRLMRDRKLPAEVVMHGVVFSMLSPGTPVPLQEAQFAKLVDSMKKTGHDPRSPGFESTIDHWMNLNAQHAYPEHSREFFVGHPGVHYKLKDGSMGGVKATNDKPEQKATSILQYHTYHDALTQLIKQHGHDAQTVADLLMGHKEAGRRHAEKDDRLGKKGLPPQEPYLQGRLSVFGLAPKTARYALAMAGGGNLVVPDTHFIRHLFGMDISKDADTIEALKVKYLWNPRHHHLLNGIDRWYGANHPAVKFMLEHPRWGKEFSEPQHAIFPGFWRHWMSILPHERARGMAAEGHNEYTTHAPFWDATDPFLKAEDLSDLPLHTAQVHQQYVKHLGEVPASMLYATFLLPRLLQHGDARLHEAFADRLLAGAAPRLERIAADIRSAAPAGAPAHAQGELWPGAQIRAIRTVEGLPIGRVLLLHGALHHLEDYHGTLRRLLPEGPLDAGGVARLHAFEGSPHLSVALDHQLPVEQDVGSETTGAGESAPAGGTAEHGTAGSPGPADTAPPPGSSPPPTAYRYRRVGATRESILEINGNQAYLDGAPISDNLVELMLHNVESGAGTLDPVGLDKAETAVWSGDAADLFKADMDPDEAMRHIRAGVAAGHIHPDVERAMTHIVYNDRQLSDIPIGNAYAYKKFLERGPRSGVHLMLDLNDFRNVNNTFGHDVGTQALRAYFGAVRQAVDEAVGRRHAKLFRNGSEDYDLFRSMGDEAQVHLPSHEHAVRFVYALREKLAALPPVGGTHRLSAAIGVGATPEEADAAMYQAKAGKFTAPGSDARRYPSGHVPNLMYSVIPGHEGPVNLAGEAPPAAASMPATPPAA